MKWILTLNSDKQFWTVQIKVQVAVFSRTKKRKCSPEQNNFHKNPKENWTDATQLLLSVFQFPTILSRKARIAEWFVSVLNKSNNRFKPY
jgi:hypothetical protein